VCGNDAASGLLRAALPHAAHGAGRLAAVAHELSPSALAAFGAVLAGERPPQFVTGAIRQRRTARHHRWTAGLAAAAGIVLVLAGAVHLHGVRREIDAAEAVRRAMAADVAAAAEARRSLAALQGRVEAIAALEADAGPRWTGFFAELAGALPDSAYIVSFTGDGDQIKLGGFAHEAHAIVPALQSSALLGDAAFAAPLRRDGTDGRERFELAVPVRAAGPAALRPEAVP
jgi:hypothetical protein